MLNLYPRLSASTRSGEGDASSSDDGLARPRAFFGIAVACVAILLFCCVLAATGSALKAGVFAATAALVLVVLGCFAPRTSWIRRRGRRTGRPATAVLPLRARSSGACSCAPSDAPPAFAYVCPLEAGDGEEAVPGSVVITVICPVCLEGVHDGEMVRQLPACKHVFHVECINMWLHSNRTCPMCRCVISPPQTVTAKASESEEASASASDDEALPPV